MSLFANQIDLTGPGLDVKPNYFTVSSDVVLRVGGIPFHVERKKLADVSDFFRTTFETAKDAKEVPMAADPNVLYEALKFIYTPKWDRSGYNPNPKLLREVAEFAHQYHIPTLLTRCENNLMSSPGVFGFGPTHPYSDAELLTIANRFHLTALRMEVIKRLGTRATLNDTEKLVIAGSDQKTTLTPLIEELCLQVQAERQIRARCQNELVRLSKSSSFMINPLDIAKFLQSIGVSAEPDFVEKGLGFGNKRRRV